MSTTTDQLEVKATDNIKIPMEVVNLDIHMIHNLDHIHVTENICKLCKRNLAAPTLEDIQTGTINSKVSLGKCGHSFHSSCIDKYIKAGNISCPIDMTSWNLNRELDQNIVFKKIVHKSKSSNPNPSYVIAKKTAK
jgi:hypothetical protein